MILYDPLCLSFPLGRLPSLLMRSQDQEFFLFATRSCINEGHLSQIQETGWISSPSCWKESTSDSSSQNANVSNIDKIWIKNQFRLQVHASFEYTVTEHITPGSLWCFTTKLFRTHLLHLNLNASIFVKPRIQICIFPTLTDLRLKHLQTARIELWPAAAAECDVTSPETFWKRPPFSIFEKFEAVLGIETWGPSHFKTQLLLWCDQQDRIRQVQNRLMHVDILGHSWFHWYSRVKFAQELQNRPKHVQQFQHVAPRKKTPIKSK